MLAFLSGVKIQHISQLSKSTVISASNQGATVGSLLRSKMLYSTAKQRIQKRFFVPVLSPRPVDWGAIGYNEVELSP
jgi:hypothetical protein